MSSPSPAVELYRRLVGCAGVQYLNRSKQRAFTLHAFRANFAVLHATCAEFEDPEKSAKYFHESPAGPGTAAHMEVVRHLHNFLAAAKTLVDHTRVFVEEHYADTELESNYLRKVADSLAPDGVVRFVHDLRNYMLHRSLPPASMSMTFSRTEPTGPGNVATTVYTDRNELLGWTRWSPPARKYLDAQPEKFKLIDFCAPYGEKILSFHTWLDSALAQHHAADIAEFEQLNRQFAETQRPTR